MVVNILIMDKTCFQSSVFHEQGGSRSHMAMFGFTLQMLVQQGSKLRRNYSLPFKMEHTFTWLERQTKQTHSSCGS